MTGPAEEGVRVLLLDVEGTTTPVAFVYDVLFPHARAHVEAFLRAHADRPDVRADLERLREEHRGEAEGPPGWRDGSVDAEVASAVAYLHWLMDRDRKSTPLKSLQGKVWEAGYREGTLRGQVYPDVPGALERWRGQGREVAIFSSGSVLGQRLLFAHSEAGDLTRHIGAYFDTTTGPKREADSYRAIAEALGVEPAAVLFLSDVAAELDAAAAAGMATGLCVRPGAPEPDDPDHPVVRDFDSVLPAG